MLTAHHDKFREVLAEEIDLPPLDGGPEQLPIVLKAFVFRKGESHTRSGRVTRDPIHPARQTYFDTEEHWVIACEENPGGISETYRSSVLYAATLHLMSAYRWALVRERRGAPATWTDPKSTARLFWFEVGLGELLSETRTSEDGAIEFLVPSRKRLEALKAWRKRGGHLWRLHELLEMTSFKTLRDEIRRRSLPESSSQIAVFSCQAWTWMYFLYYFEEGKYRSKLLEYVARHLRGQSGLESFRSVWGADEGYDWAPVEWEWRLYVVDLLKLVD